MAEGGHMDKNQNVNNNHVSVLDRLASFPLVQSTYQIASLAYSDVKNVHPVVGYFCEVSERGVKVASDLAVTGVAPLVKAMEAQVTAINNAALQVVEQLEGRLPILDQPADEVVSVFRERLVSGVQMVKDRAVDRVQGAVARTRSVARESYEVVAIAASFLETLEVRDMVKVAAYFVVTQAEDLVERYLPEESDTGGPESSSSSDEMEEMDDARFGLVPRSQEVVRAVITRSFRKLRPFLNRYWNFLQSAARILLAIASQMRQYAQTALWLVLPQITSVEEKPAKRKAGVTKKKSEALRQPGQSPGKAHSIVQSGFLFRVVPENRRKKSGTDGGGTRARRRQSFDSSFFPSRIQEDVVDNVFDP